MPISGFSSSRDMQGNVAMSFPVHVMEVRPMRATMAAMTATMTMLFVKTEHDGDGDGFHAPISGKRQSGGTRQGLGLVSTERLPQEAREDQHRIQSHAKCPEPGTGPRRFRRGVLDAARAGMRIRSAASAGRSMELSSRAFGGPREPEARPTRRASANRSKLEAQRRRPGTREPGPPWRGRGFVGIAEGPRTSLGSGTGDTGAGIEDLARGVRGEKCTRWEQGAWIAKQAAGNGDQGSGTRDQVRGFRTKRSKNRDKGIRTRKRGRGHREQPQGARI